MYFRVEAQQHVGAKCCGACASAQEGLWQAALLAWARSCLTWPFTVDDIYVSALDDNVSVAHRTYRGISHGHIRGLRVVIFLHLVSAGHACMPRSWINLFSFITFVCRSLLNKFPWRSTHQPTQNFYLPRCVLNLFLTGWYLGERQHRKAYVSMRSHLTTSWRDSL